MRWANLGIISYLPNAVNQTKVPTKLYDYSRYQVPYLIQENTLWHRVGQRLGGAIGVNLHNLSDDRMAIALQNPPDPFQKPFPANDTWEHESINALNSIDRLFVNQQVPD